jgi:hypothetical protein
MQHQQGFVVKFSPLLLGFLALAAAPLSAQGTGVQFIHGIDQSIDVPYDPLLVPKTGLTVEAWIRYDESAIPTGTYHWPTIVRQNVAPGQETYMLRVSAGSTGNRDLAFKVVTAAGGITALYTFPPGALATWSHVAGTYDGATVRLLLNGHVVAMQTGNGQPLLDNGGILSIGNGDLSSPGAETWAGEIDEVRIWPFARATAEIVQTQNDMMASLPGGVATFNLDGHTLDTSSGLVGTLVGGPTYVPTLPLTPWGSSAFAYGTSTTACTPLRSAIGSKPIVPAPDFTVRCVRAPASAPGFFLVGLGAYASPFPVLGVDVFVDLAQVIVLAPISSNALGLATVKIGIDPNPSLVGVTAYTQFAFSDAACGAVGFTSSDALSVTIQ